MPFTYDSAELAQAAMEKHTRVREAIREHVAPLTLQQLQTDLQGTGPSYGQLLKHRLIANAKKGRKLTLGVPRIKAR